MQHVYTDASMRTTPRRHGTETGPIALDSMMAVNVIHEDYSTSEPALFSRLSSRGSLTAKSGSCSLL
jgi:hypothetical protein